uniref:Replication protein A OB domain-containing protein n=1 Tax=Trichogramma kaykai TaxID=54128 RepID=A0ABD2W2D5_9HYME
MGGKNVNLTLLNQNYVIKNFAVIPSNEKYNNLNNQFEILLTDETTINYYKETIKFYKNTVRYEDLTEILKKPTNTLFNTTAIVEKIKPHVTIHSTRTNKDYVKQEIELVNETNFKIILTLWNKPTNLEIEVLKIYSFTNLRITQGNYVKGLNAIVETTAIQETQSSIALKLLPVLQEMIKTNIENNTSQNISNFENLDDNLLCTAMEEFENRHTQSTTEKKNINIIKEISHITINQILEKIITTTDNSNSQEEINGNEKHNTHNMDLIPNMDDSTSFDNDTLETITTDDNNEPPFKKQKRFN